MTVDTVEPGLARPLLIASPLDDEPDQDFGDDGRENAVDEDELNAESEDDLSGEQAVLDADEVETIRDGLSQ